MARPDLPRDPRPADTRPDAASLERLAYDEGKRALADQTDELNGIRTRAGSYMAFVGSATAFLVGTGLKAADRDAWFYALASVASTASLLTLVLIALVLDPYRPRKTRNFLKNLRQRRLIGREANDDGTSLTKQQQKSARRERRAESQWWLSMSPRTLAEDWISGPDRRPTESMMLHKLALKYDEMLVHNDELLSGLRHRYVSLVVAGGVALLLWGWLVWIRA